MELENKKTATGLVEECYKLSIGDLGKHLLYPIGSNRMYAQHKELENLKGKSGEVILSALYSFKLLKVNYRVHFDDVLRLEIFFGSNYQIIPLDTTELYYGTNVYMLCSCGRRCQVLYMRKDTVNRFACRDCLNLKYEMTTFNRNTQLGVYSVLLHRHQKLMAKQLGVKRIDYNGNITRKARSIIKLSRETAVPTI
jgi:hypothetical protein